MAPDLIHDSIWTGAHSAQNATTAYSTAARITGRSNLVVAEQRRHRVGRLLVWIIAADEDHRVVNPAHPGGGEPYARRHSNKARL